MALAWICAALGRRWVIEQPMGSMMEHHPRMKHLITSLGVRRHSTSMSRFGAKTQKATWLYSNCDNIAELDFFAPPLPAQSVQGVQGDVPVSIIYEDLQKQCPKHRAPPHALKTSKFRCALCVSEPST